MQRRLGLAALLALALGSAQAAHAGYFELSFNGMYFRSDNGVINNQSSYSTTLTLGGGFSYHFLSNTAIEISYENKRITSVITQATASIAGGDISVTTDTIYHNLSLNLIFDFAGQKSTFRPYIRAGGGYYYKQHRLRGTFVTGPNAGAPISLSSDGDVASVSVNAGLGFKVFVTNSIAIDIAGTLYASELDQPRILYHYSVTGGLRFLF